MLNFFQPVNGSKLGEFKISWIKRSVNGFMEWLEAVFRLFLGIGFIVISAYPGITFMTDPFKPIWCSWLVGIFLCLVGVILAIFILGKIIAASGIKINVDDINAESCSLFIVRNGLEINEKFIPIKNSNSSEKGIVLFKIDGDYLLIRTEGGPFIKFYGQYENQIKFKIEPKYRNCKDELLTYLNSLIDIN